MRSIIRILGSAKEAATDYVVAANQGQVSEISTVIWLAAALLVADLANTVPSNIGGYLGDTMAAKLRATLSGRCFAKLLSPSSCG